jgi:REP element-mobilizing transposase RayT
MLVIDYRADEVRFAFCHHAYLRWCSYRLRPCPALARLNLPTLQALADRHAIKILECHSEPADVRVLVSLQPQETVSACASKLKGQTSKWLRERLQLDRPADLLARGYFACTSGKSKQEQVDAYLSAQSEHHGYGQRQRPPVYVHSFPSDPTTKVRLQAQHAVTVLRYHLVLATWRRCGVFGCAEGRAIAERWRQLEAEERFALLKVSFLPDHVHVAVQAHPSLSPGVLVVRFMNAAQRLIWERFQASAIQAGIERLWQPSAYVGSFGDWATPQLQHYIRNWREGRREERG